MKKQNIIFLSILLLVGVVFAIYFTKLSAYKNAPSNTSSIKNYFNPIRGIKFSYDSSWKQDQTVVDGERPVIAVLRKGSSVISLSHYSKADSNYATFEQLKAGTPKALEFLPGFKNLSDDTHIINSIDTYSISYKNNDDRNYTWMNLTYCFFTPGKEYYCMTYGASENKYNEKEAQQFINAVNTFEVAEN
ncbi:MAG: hypothetical protein E6Q58_02440 [Niabella sp.]|nr:MAG: hypothetical protein E6Q58_02440 [Niabella sp.]